QLTAHVSVLHFKPARISGSSHIDKVHQTPAESFYTSEETAAKINCVHHIQDYNRIFWYKQSKNNELQLLGYMNVDKDYPESGVNVTMTGRSTKGETCILTIKGLNLNSSAVYFCVASHTVLYSTVSQYKNLPSATFFFFFISVL
uniref:Ig-like domain-containing protein n=1 Tax=Oreochromis aureus TaxID=47969 RepID=A0AAZ1XRR8_OREAU